MRIVSLLSGATEILFAIGAGEEVVAISHECDYPPEAIHLPRATRSLIDSSQPSEVIDSQVKHLMESGEALYDIDRALIRGLQPNLIVTQAQCDVCAVRYQDVVDFVAQDPLLTQTRIVALNPQSLTEVLQDVLTIGEATGASQSADRFAASLTRRIDHVRTQARSASEGPALRPRVICIEWVNPLMTAGNWTPELIEIAGGASCLATPRRHSAYVTWTDILAARPEVLLIAPCGFNLARSLAEARQLVELPGFNSIPAVINHRAFVIDGNAYLNRSGPRLIDTLELLAHLIHPNLFPQLPNDLAEGLAWARMPR